MFWNIETSSHVRYSVYKPSFPHQPLFISLMKSIIKKIHK